MHHPDRRTGAAKEMARQIEVLRKVFGPLPMTEISKPLIETFRLDRRQAHEAGKAAIDQLAALELAKATDDTIEIPAALVKDAQRARVRTEVGACGDESFARTTAASVRLGHHRERTAGGVPLHEGGPVGHQARWESGNRTRATSTG